MASTVGRPSLGGGGGSAQSGQSKDTYAVGQLNSNIFLLGFRADKHDKKISSGLV